MCNPPILQQEWSGGQGSIQGRAPPLQYHDKGLQASLCNLYFCNPSYEYKILMLAFKCLHGLAPHYLQALVPKYEPVRMTRSPCDRYLLKHNWTSLKMAADHSFGHAAPTLWNKLPYSIRSLDSLCSFKQSLKTYLFRSYYS